MQRKLPAELIINLCPKNVVIEDRPARWSNRRLESLQQSEPVIEICLLQPQTRRGPEPDREIRILSLCQERSQSRPREVIHSPAKVYIARQLEPSQPGS